MLTVPPSTTKPRLLLRFRIKPPPVKVMGVEILGRTSVAAKVMLPVMSIWLKFGSALASFILVSSSPNVVTKTPLYASLASWENAKAVSILPVVTSSSQSPPKAAFPVKLSEAATSALVS